MSLNQNATTVLTALRAEVEGTCQRDSNGVVQTWGTVYLDNARPAGMSVTVFRAALRSLSLSGLYRVVDGDAFGEVVVK